MKRAFQLLVCIAALAAGTAQAQSTYTPPVMRDNGKGISVWFGHVVRTGQWCAFDKSSVKLLYREDRLAADEQAWARYDAGGLQSVTLVQQSEDALAEDQYFIGPKGQVIKMIRTGHYIKDPLASVIFEPDDRGRLRLARSSKSVVERMKNADYDPYFVDWDHYSQLSQLPFVKLLDLKKPPPTGACQDNR